MSWEESEPIKRPCPCGVGHYLVIERSDDWNRFEERWEMHCPDCVATNDLYARDYTRKGITATYRGWVPRSVLLELAAATAAVDEAKKCLTAYAVEAVGERWNAHFAGKTKKTVWRELTEHGKHYPSLGTFYVHVRDADLARVLKRYLEPRDLPTVVRILGLSGSELAMRIAEAERMERDLRELDNRAREQGVN